MGVWRRPTIRPSRTFLLTLGILAHLIVWAVCVLSPGVHLGDFRRYWQIGTATSRPFIDAPIEYPPGAVLVFQMLAGMTGGEPGFFVGLLLLNLAADAIVLAVLVAAWGASAGAVYLVISVPIMSLLFFRFDLWPVAAATAAVACWMRARWRTSLGFLGLGVALKLWPLPLAALLLAGPTTFGSRRTSLTWLAVAGAAGAAAWFWYAGPAGFLSVLTFRGATGWGIEGTIGSVWRIVDPASIRLEAGAVRAGHTVPLLSVALPVAALPLACWAVYRGAVLNRVGIGWVTGVGAILVCSALLSPQFLAWLLPGAALAWAEGDRRTTRWLALLVAVTVLYRILHTTQMPGLVLARNLMLLAMVGEGLWQLWRASASEPRQDSAVVRLEPDNPPGR